MDHHKGMDIIRETDVMAIMRTQRSGDFPEIQIGPLDVELASMLGVFVKAALPDQLEAFRDRAEKEMKKKRIGFSGRPWVQQR